MVSTLPSQIHDGSLPESEFEESDWLFVEVEGQNSWSNMFGGPALDEYHISTPDYMRQHAVGYRTPMRLTDTASGESIAASAFSDYGEADPILTVWLDGSVSLSGSQIDLDDMNRHFRRKAASVINDGASLRLLAEMYSKKVVETSEFDFCRDGRSLAKLTAAHFCEVGVNGIYITDRGYRFFDFLKTK